MACTTFKLAPRMASFGDTHIAFELWNATRCVTSIGGAQVALWGLEVGAHGRHIVPIDTGRVATSVS